VMSWGVPVDKDPSTRKVSRQKRGVGIGSSRLIEKTDVFLEERHNLKRMGGKRW